MTKEAMSDAAFDQLLARINMVSTFKLTVIFMWKVKQTFHVFSDFCNLILILVGIVTSHS